MSFALFSYVDKLDIGIATDPEAIPDHARLRKDLEDAFDEVLALDGKARRGKAPAARARAARSKSPKPRAATGGAPSARPREGRRLEAVRSSSLLGIGRTEGAPRGAPSFSLQSRRNPRHGHPRPEKKGRDAPLLAITLATMLGALFLLWLASIRLRDASIGTSSGAGLRDHRRDGVPPHGRRHAPAGPRHVAGPDLGRAPGDPSLREESREGGGLPLSGMRRRHGTGSGSVSLVTVFGFQALLPVVHLLSAPGGAGLARSGAPHGARRAGPALCGRRVPLRGGGRSTARALQGRSRHRGRVMDRGLWAWTRHPNYFADALLWWGFYLLACSTPDGVWTFASPLAMTFLLMRRLARPPPRATPRPHPPRLRRLRAPDQRVHSEAAQTMSSAPPLMK